MPGPVRDILDKIKSGEAPPRPEPEKPPVVRTIIDEIKSGEAPERPVEPEPEPAEPSGHTDPFRLLYPGTMPQPPGYMTQSQALDYSRQYEYWQRGQLSRQQWQLQQIDDQKMYTYTRTVDGKTVTSTMPGWMLKEKYLEGKIEEIEEAKEDITTSGRKYRSAVVNAPPGARFTAEQTDAGVMFSIKPSLKYENIKQKLLADTPESRGLLLAASWTAEDPLGLKSAYQMATGQKEAALETKIQALTGITDKSFLEYYFSSPGGIIALSYTGAAAITAGAPVIGSAIASKIGMGATTAIISKTVISSAVLGGFIGLSGANVKKAFDVDVAEGVAEITRQSLMWSSAFAGGLHASKEGFFPKKPQKIIIKSDTIAGVNPKNPTEIKFITRSRGLKGKDIFSKGRIEDSGRFSTITGRTYFGKKIIPFRGGAGNEPIGEMGDFMFSRGSGTSIPFKKTLFGNYKPMLKKLITFKGESVQRSFYEGESFIDTKGFLQQFKNTVSFASSKGTFKGFKISGEFDNTIITITPKIKGAVDYFGETGGFDYRLLTQTIQDSIILPGGIGTETSILAYPAGGSIYLQLQEQQKILNRLESLESGIQGSSYWIGVIPQTGKTNLSSRLNKVNQALASKTGLGQTSVQTPISSQLNQQTQLQQNLQKQEQLLNQTQTQLQERIQTQTQTQIQEQQQQQIQSIMQLQTAITQPITPTTIFPFTLPGGGFTPTQKRKPGQAYKVQYKEQYIFEGKQRKPQKYKTLKTAPLSYSDADKLGSYIIDESTARSYKLIPVKGKPQKMKYDITGRQHKFYKGKKGENIEKTTFAIDSKGELEGITAKGILASMNRQYRRKQPSRRTMRQSQPVVMRDIEKLFKVKI